MAVVELDYMEYASAAAARAAYVSNDTGYVSSLKAYFKMEAASGASQVDSVAGLTLAKTGTTNQITGKVNYGGQSVWTTKPAVGPSYWRNSTSAGLPSGNSSFTIIGWMYMTTNPTSGWGPMISWGAASGYDGTHATLNGRQMGFYQPNNTWLYGAVGSTVLSLTTWYWLRWQYDNTTGYLNCYINNGASDGQGAMTVTPTTTSANCGIGCFYNAQNHFVNGYFDEIAVFDRNLTSDECTAIYNGGSGASLDGITTMVNYQTESESTIKTQGTYALKCFAAATGSLNNTLTRTIGSPINLTGKGIIKFDIYSSRTGSNIKIGIHDSGGTTTEITPNVTSAGQWQTVTWNIGAVSSANKDAIDQIIITVVNADADNTFYIDNMYADTGTSVYAVSGITQASISKIEGVSISDIAKVSSVANVS